MRNCIGKHRAGDGSYHLFDLNGTPVLRVCEVCEPEVRAQRPGRTFTSYKDDLAREARILNYRAHWPWKPSF